MPALDTNVLVRFLMQDHVAQGRAASRLIEAGLEAGTLLFVPVTVLLELEWVLRTLFGVDKAAMLQTLHRLVASVDLDVESEPAVELALLEYAGARADFADCLHTALAVARGATPMWTFDRAASKLEGARLLPAR